MIQKRKMAVRSMNNRHDAKKESETEATIYLYGDIGGYFGIDSQEWVKELSAIKADTIHIRIDSDGGDVFAARAMKTAIMQHKAKTVAHIDGLAASAASFLAMGADEIEIVDGGFIMIHNALSFMDILGYFNADDLQDLIDDISKERELHDKINNAIADDYAKRTGAEKDQVLSWMNDETWFDATEAMNNKFVNRVYDGKPVEGAYDLSTFQNTPQAVKDRNTQFPKRALEKALRDAGLSQKEAKSILSEGFKDGDTRDVIAETDRDGLEETPKEEPKAAKTNDRTAELIKKATALMNS